jgi:SAM-dependent methyltransferase
MGLDPRYHCRITNPLFLHRTLLYRHVKQNAPRIIAEARQITTHTPRLLDVGCGYMPYRELFEQAGNVRYQGADIPWAKVQPDVAIDATTGRIAASDSSYEAVVHFQALEHVPNAELLLAECFRVLRPGGHLFCTVPFVYPFHPVPGDFRRWTTQGLANDLHQAGFTSPHSSTVECDFVSWVTLTNLYLADVMGYRITKPLCLALNLLGWLLRHSRHHNLTLTVFATAVKPLQEELP